MSQHNPGGADMKSQAETPNDDSPLLRNDVNASGSGDADPLSSLAAHRNRIGALLQVLWDSGAMCVCSAAVVFSFAALFVKLMGHSMPVFQIVAFRSVASFSVCAAYARMAGISPLFGHRANLRFLLSRGLFGAAAMTTYYFCIKMLPLADAVTLFFLNPAITAVAAWAIMREPLGLRGVAGVLVSLCGLVLVTRPPFLFSSTSHDSSNSASLHGDGGVGISTDAAGGGGDGGGGGWDADRMLGSMFGLLSAVLSAGAFISIRYIGKSEPALVVSVYFHVCAAGSSVVPLVAGLPAPAVWPTGAQWALLAGVSACSFWGQILIGRSFQLLNAAKASAINLTQVVYSYLLGLMFLHERLTLLGAAGSVLIAGGAVLVNLRPKTAPAASGGAGTASRKEANTAAGSSSDADPHVAEAAPAAASGGASAAVVEMVGVRVGSEDGAEGRASAGLGREDLERRPLLGAAELLGRRGQEQEQRCGGEDEADERQRRPEQRGDSATAEDSTRVEAAPLISGAPGAGSECR